MEIDGRTTEWEADEGIFQLNAQQVTEESWSDSKWGVNNDLHQVWVTWDADFLYVAVDAIIWDNNTVLLFDVRPGGMTAMTNLNSWRRNFTFQNQEPDLFLATWDGNTLPQLWDYRGSNQVTRFDATTFRTVATFAQGNRDRAMEAAIPWRYVLGERAERIFSTEIGDSVYRLPSGIDTLKFVNILTAGPDGTGGPDSAPDNLSCHTINSSDAVTIENYAAIPLDLDGDRIPDLGADVRGRLSFFFPPPVPCIRFEIADVQFATGADVRVSMGSILSPEEGRDLEFRMRLSPEVSPSDSLRHLLFSADVFDMRGRRVRSLFNESRRPVTHPGDPALDRWDGRDESGALVPGGIYILRVVIEPDANRFTKAFAVVR